MVGIFALAGGDEFGASYAESDRALIALLPLEQQRIVIVPTAAGRQGPEVAVANGVRHFHQLAPRAIVEGVLVVDAASANDRQCAARIAAAGMVYLTGGDPGYLVHALRGSEALAAIAAVAARGGIVAGSSAGAMALGEMMRWGERWEAGLGLVRRVVVLPHHPERPATLAITRAGLAEHIVALGIPVGVTCICQPASPHSDEGAVWRIVGAQPITIYRAEGVTQVQPNETFSL